MLIISKCPKGISRSLIGSVQGLAALGFARLPISHIMTPRPFFSCSRCTPVFYYHFDKKYQQEIRNYASPSTVNVITPFSSDQLPVASTHS